MLRAGIIGLPNVGKSTLFNAVVSSGAKAEASNYRFCTIDPNVGLVNVADERLDRIAAIVNPKKITPTQLEIVDIAGLVRGASRGEGLGNQFLANIREVDAIIHVVRCFEDENVLREEGAISPEGDVSIINTELQLKDLEMVEKRMQKIQKQLRSDPKAKEEMETLQLCQQTLSQGKDLRQIESDEIKDFLAPLFFLTLKPVIYVANVGEEHMETGNVFSDQLSAISRQEDAQVIVMSNNVEEQITQLEDEEEKKMFMEAYHMKIPALDKLIQATYGLLSLRTYLTAGEQEVRVWTINKGWKAPQAAGVIHSDFEKGFIKAEVISYEDYISYQSESACRNAGKLRIEGKEYVVQDGDVMHFRFNV